MQNNTFRAAFWALFISLGLCLTAAVVSPQTRLAMNRMPMTLPPQDGFLLAEYPRVQLGPPEAFPNDWRVASTDPSFVPRITMPPAVTVPQPSDAPQPEKFNRRVPSPYEPHATSPPPYEVTPAPEMPQELKQDPTNATAPNLMEIPQVASREFEAAELISPPVHTGVYEELPPPPLQLVDDVRFSSSQSDEIAHSEDSQLMDEVYGLRRELAQLEVQQLKREVERARDRIESTPVLPVAPGQSAQTSIAPTWIPLQPGQLTAVDSQVASPSPETSSDSRPQDRSVEVEAEPAPRLANTDAVLRASESDVKERWNFEFKQAPVDEVLVMLGEHAGTGVIVEPGITGTFTQTFTNADPQQAFARVIKTFGLGVDLRGDYIFVRQSR